MEGILSPDPLYRLEGGDSLKRLWQMGGNSERNLTISNVFSTSLSKVAIRDVFK